MKSYEMGFCFVVCNEATNLLSLRFQTNIFPIVVPAARSVPSVDQQVVVKITPVEQHRDNLDRILRGDGELVARF